MARPKSTVPTPGEIEILHVLWQRGVCTVKDVHHQLVKHRKVAHTTVASMMQLMDGKGQLKVVQPTRPFRYEAVLGPDEAKDILLNDIKTRLFGGSTKKMIQHVAAGTRLTKPRQQQLEKLLDGIG